MAKLPNDRGMRKWVTERMQRNGWKLNEAIDKYPSILMPENFKPEGLTSKTPISAKKEELGYVNKMVVSADGDVSIRVTNDWNRATRTYDTLEITIPKSKKRGEKYFNDEVLLSLIWGQFTGTSKLKAEFPRRNLDAIMKRLDELGVTVQEEHQEGSNSGRRYDEDIEEEKKVRSVEEVQPIFDALASKYQSLPIECVSLSETSDRDFVETFYPGEVEGATEEEIKEGAANLRNYFPRNTQAVYDDETKKIIIFADQIKEGDEENVFFHENIHAILHRWYGKGTTRGIADRFWDSSPEQIEARTKSRIKRQYKKKSDVVKHEEWLTYVLADAMSNGNFGQVEEYLSDDSDRERINNILSEFNYEREREGREREAQKTNSLGNDGGRLQQRQVLGGAHERRIGEHQSRIAEHIDGLTEKLGTKERTTVYHSFDELPEADKKHIREAEKKGRKVRGWYENGHIYLYLPHIDSEYQAEKTIWHETVAHHGLRELVGEENYDELLKQLWLNSPTIEACASGSRSVCSETDGAERSYR